MEQHGYESVPDARRPHRAPQALGGQRFGSSRRFFKREQISNEARASATSSFNNQRAPQGRPAAALPRALVSRRRPEIYPAEFTKPLKEHDNKKQRNDYVWRTPNPRGGALSQLLVIVGNLEHVLAACRSPISTASARICSARWRLRVVAGRKK
jgi:hypothetical protein